MAATLRAQLPSVSAPMEDAGHGVPKATSSPARKKSPTPAVEGRGEVDTSSPFASVREAIGRFGGGAAPPWPAPQYHFQPKEIELMKLEEQTVKLEMELFVKERETFKVLQELETTKQTIHGLKLQLQTKTAEVTIGTGIYSNAMKAHPLPECNAEFHLLFDRNAESIMPCSTGRKPSPRITLIELKQAKTYLNQRNIEMLKSQIEEEKFAMEKTRERILMNSAKAASLEQIISKTAAELHRIKDSKSTASKGTTDIRAQIKQLHSDKEKFKRIAEDSKSEISGLTAEIEQIRCRTKTIEVRLLIAKKMKEAAKSGEGVALAEINSIRIREESAVASSKVALAVEDYAVLLSKAHEADVVCRSRIEAAMLEVEAANKSKARLLDKVEEAMAEVKTGRKALEEALEREKAADKAKKDSEEALRRWQSGHGQNRRSVHNTTKFKNSASAAPRRECSSVLDVNGLSLVAGGEGALSIGQILSRKLMAPEEYEARMRGKTNGKQKVSLGQILSQSNDVHSPSRIDDGAVCRQFGTKRKRLGFVVLALLMAMQRKKKRKPALKTGLSFRNKVV